MKRLPAPTWWPFDSFSPNGGYLFSVGSAGDPPAPLGDSASGTGRTLSFSKAVLVRAVPLPIPSGGSPDGTGESPVLPTLKDEGVAQQHTRHLGAQVACPLTPTLSPDGGEGARRLFPIALLVLVVIFNGCSTPSTTQHPARAFSHADIGAMEFSLRRAMAMDAKGNYAEAEVEARRIIHLMERRLGPTAQPPLEARSDLAIVLLAAGRIAEAQAELRYVFETRQRALGPMHPDTLRSRSILCAPLICQRKFAQAEAEYRAILELQAKTPGIPSRDELENRANLACVLALQGNDMLAEVFFRNALGDMEQLLGPEHPLTLTTLGSLTYCLGRRNKLQEARALAPRLVESSMKVFGPSSFKAKYYQSLEIELNRGRLLPLAGPEPEKGR